MPTVRTVLQLIGSVPPTVLAGLVLFPIESFLSALRLTLLLHLLGLHLISFFQVKIVVLPPIMLEMLLEGNRSPSSLDVGQTLLNKNFRNNSS